MKASTNELLVFASDNNCDKEALFELGERYVRGRGVDKNYKKAREYFEESAKLGFEPAKAILKAMDEILPLYRQ